MTFLLSVSKHQELPGVTLTVIKSFMVRDLLTLEMLYWFILLSLSCNMVSSNHTFFPVQQARKAALICMRMEWKSGVLKE